MTDKITTADDSRLLDLLDQKLGRVLRGLDRISVDLDAIKCDLGEARARSANVPRRQVRQGAGRRPGSDSTVSPLLVASLVQFEYEADGSAQVAIDGRLVRLSPTLAGFLKVLGADAPRSAGDSDPLVVWKPVSEVALRLVKQTGGAVSPGQLNNLVYRLRLELLRQGGVAREFVQRHPRLGLRVALIRDPASIAPVDCL